MTTRPRAAAVFNDMVNVGLRPKGNPEHTRKIEESGLITNTARAVEGLRELDVPIFWVRVERRQDRADIIDNRTDLPIGWHKPDPITAGSYEGAQVDELPILPVDQVILKPRFDPFIGTDLDLQLRARGVDTVLVGGHSTNVGVESCARTAHDLGYNVIVLSDCCFHVDRELHDFAIQRILPRFARVLTSEQALHELR